MRGGDTAEFHRLMLPISGRKLTGWLPSVSALLSEAIKLGFAEIEDCGSRQILWDPMVWVETRTGDGDTTRWSPHNDAVEASRRALP